MGYMGFGLQKWIYTMKPRKLFKKGNKKPGYETTEFLKPREFRLSETTINNPEILEERIKASKKRIAFRVKVGRIYSVLIIAGILGVIVLVYIGISEYMSKFQENHNAVLILNTIEEENAVVVFIESGILHLKNSEIENAINDFKLALSIDPYNKTALYNITLAFSIDCEINARNCDETFEYFERLKKLDEGSVSEELEVRMVVIEEKMKKRWKE
jgi:tetratricopeptide (TPR) repeat protein